MTRTKRDRRDRLHRALAQNEALHLFIVGFVRYVQGDHDRANRHLRASGAALAKVRP